MEVSFRGFPERSEGLLLRGFGVQGKGAASPFIPLHSDVEARVTVSYRGCRRAEGYASCAWTRRAVGDSGEGER